MQHGLASRAGPHAGDLPDPDVNIVGRGRLRAATDRATLSARPRGPFDDQVTDPIRDSGARIACGVIEVDR